MLTKNRKQNDIITLLMAGLLAMFSSPMVAMKKNIKNIKNIKNQYSYLTQDEIKNYGIDEVVHTSTLLNSDIYLLDNTDTIDNSGSEVKDQVIIDTIISNQSNFEFDQNNIEDDIENEFNDNYFLSTIQDIQTEKQVLKSDNKNKNKTLGKRGRPQLEKFSWKEVEEFKQKFDKNHKMVKQCIFCGLTLNPKLYTNGLLHIEKHRE